MPAFIISTIFVVHFGQVEASQKWLMNVKLRIKNEKIVGYVLLTVGVAMIFVSVYLMFSVFTGVSSPPILLHFSDISLPLPGETEAAPMISGQELSKMIAMGLWYLLMFFIMWAGGKVASLGVNLIKEVRVEVKGLTTK